MHEKQQNLSFLCMIYRFVMVYISYTTVYLDCFANPPLHRCMCSRCCIIQRFTREFFVLFIGRLVKCENIIYLESSRNFAICTRYSKNYLWRCTLQRFFFIWTDKFTAVGWINIDKVSIMDYLFLSDRMKQNISVL